MKKLLTIIAVLMGIATLAGAATYSFLPIYSIVGNVTGISAAPSEGQTVVFFRSLEDYDKLLYTADKVGTVGAAKTADKFILNAAGNPLMPTLGVGSKYFVAVAQDSNGYGAGPVEVTVSGKGYDAAPDMVMALGAGVHPPYTGEPNPKIRLWFGNRLYQPQILKEGEPFVVSANPEIRVDISIAEPFTLDKNIESYAIQVDPGTTAPQTLKVDAANVTTKGYVTGTAADENKFNSLSLKVAMPAALTSGEHKFVVSARSSGLTSAAASTSQIATVEVMGGPLRILGPVIVYPSPFSIRTQGTCSIMYTMTAAANIDIYIYSVSSQLVKKYTLSSGTEGGNAGTNKVVWDGRTDSGLLAGNAVYVGTIISKEDNRLLAKFKFTVLD